MSRKMVERLNEAILSCQGRNLNWEGHIQMDPLDVPGPGTAIRAKLAGTARFPRSARLSQVLVVVAIESFVGGEPPRNHEKNTELESAFVSHVLRVFCLAINSPFRLNAINHNSIKFHFL